MCICMYVRMHACMYVSMYVCACYVSTCMQVCVCMYVCVCVYVCVYIHIAADTLLFQLDWTVNRVSLLLGNGLVLAPFWLNGEFLKQSLLIKRIQVPAKKLPDGPPCTLTRPTDNTSKSKSGKSKFRSTVTKDHCLPYHCLRISHINFPIENKSRDFLATEIRVQTFN